MMGDHSCACSDDPIAALFEEPPQRTVPDSIVLTIVRSDEHHWALHRNDGHGGGIFSSRHAALREAQDEAARLPKALIVIAGTDSPARQIPSDLATREDATRAA